MKSRIIEQTDEQLIEKWLSTQRTTATKNAYRHNIARFQAWYKLPLKTLFEKEPDEARNIALEYQNYLREQGVNVNTIIAFLTAVQSLCAYKGKPLILRRKRLSARMDLDSHVFFNEDLVKMYSVANVEQKAILATFVSLGWEVSAVLDLARDHVEDLIEKAAEQKEEFVYFLDQRTKTGCPRLGVLNPVAVESIGFWLKDSRCKGPKLFTYGTKEGVNGMLKHLARDAQIKTTGRIHTHLIRKWVMSGLSRSGMNEFQIKLVMGKRIPSSDYTYLTSLDTEVRERYPSAFEQFLDFRVPSGTKNLEKEFKKRLEEKDAQIQNLETRLNHNGEAYGNENAELRRKLDELTAYTMKLSATVYKKGVPLVDVGSIEESEGKAHEARKENQKTKSPEKKG